jgi:hypothetical protein
LGGQRLGDHTLLVNELLQGLPGKLSVHAEQPSGLLD